GERVVQRPKGVDAGAGRADLWRHQLADQAGGQAADAAAVHPHAGPDHLRDQRAHADADLVRLQQGEPGLPRPRLRRGAARRPDHQRGRLGPAPGDARRGLNTRRGARRADAAFPPLCGVRALSTLVDGSSGSKAEDQPSARRVAGIRTGRNPRFRPTAHAAHSPTTEVPMGNAPHRAVVKRTARAILLDCGPDPEDPHAAAEILLIKRTKPGRAPHWITPGGGMEPTDRTVVDALHRELLEELGAKAVDIVPAFVDTVPYGHHDDGPAVVHPHGVKVQHFFVCRLASMDPALRHGPEIEEPNG